MAITLKNLDLIDQSIQKEFENWIKTHVPQSIANTDTLKTAQYSILNYPKLWSGSRLFETRIKSEKTKDKPASEFIDDLIQKSKNENKRDEATLKEIIAFEKLFKKQASYFKEKALVQFFNKTLNDIAISDAEAAKAANEIKEKIRNLFSASALLKLQTRYDCLQTHRQISLLVQELRALVNADDKETVATVKQLEVLGKRIIDGHYEYAKKMTLTEAISNDVATATSIIGWTTGFPAAILGVAGIFFPPLLVPAGILGSISFISYTASIISVANMANQAFTYGRSPHPRDFWWMVFDIVLAPINLAGGAIFSAFANLAKPVKHLPNIINAVGNWWNNVFSNLLPDVFVVKDNIDDSKKMGSAYTARGRLRNSPTASSWSKMGSALSQTDNDASSILRKTKEEIALAKEGSKRRPDIDASYQSKEASLKLLNEQISKRDELKNIHQAVNDYFGLNDKLPLPHQFTNQDEYRAEIYRKSLALVNIMDACEKFTKDNKELAEPLALVAEITQTAKNIEQHLSESYEKLNTAKAIENTSAHGRDFAFVKVSSNSESLIFSKSHQAAILLWDRGFIGTRTSSEASAVIKAVKAYRELDPDAPSNVRLSALDIIAKNCQAYIDLNQGDSKKGRLQYVEKLAEAVKKEKAALEEFSGQTDLPVLVEFKAR